MTEDLDSLVHRVDEDRWLASRFGPRDVRSTLTTLYAVNYEIAHIGETVREPGLAEIRLLWWREAIDEIFEGHPPRSQPALQALERAVDIAPLSASHFHQMLDARRADFDAAPFRSDGDLADYIDRTAGALMRLALEACGVVGASTEVGDFIRAASFRWALTGMLRSEPLWRASGRALLPAGERSYFELLKAGADASRQLSRALPTAAFPAVGYAALVPAYLGREKVRASLPLLERQVRLLFASATGAI
ncbi:MAG: squalene/phytoene synthase family protein [Hyphomonadaceae bacterium]